MRLLGRVVLTCLKLFALAFVGWLLLLQIPELLYDFGPKTPVMIESPADLTPGRFRSATFVSIAGTPNFDKAFIYRRYGLDLTYFTLDPYGHRIVVKTYDKVTDDWRQLTRFVGKLRAFRYQPFSYRIRSIFEEKQGVKLPDDALYLGLYDMPKPSGWQVGAVIFASILWVVMLYLFFIRRRHRLAPAPPAISPPP
ncbi:MAG TPA: hypothetical protein PLE19_21040 [Planctomycetota bacterium]|nr:hypothetical protein [Planctomycetota bacterium]HRR79874.1 hypothetical protein [Planctomycetota bacterium]HRT96521.1 hypothetical protein [Planctomycetota bacterium]